MSQQNIIGIVDYKNGNTQSVINAIEQLGFSVLRCKRANDLDKVTHIILPGVGSFSACVNSLNELAIIESLENNVLIKKKPFLGICVGMQILVEQGTEFGLNSGLGWVSGICDKIQFSSGNKLLLPHVGWNELCDESGMNIIPSGTDNNDYYFVHSFIVKLSEKIDGEAYAHYGTKLLVALRKGNIYGVQFHPEKSQTNGLSLLKNFCELS